MTASDQPSDTEKLGTEAPNSPETSAADARTAAASSNTESELPEASASEAASPAPRVRAAAPGVKARPMKSQKLNRTLKELESAFTDWENLSSVKALDAKAEADAQKTRGTEQSEQEFRKRTKKLLNQLREQLAELND